MPLLDDAVVRRHDWIEDNRTEVDRLSQGRIGYVFLTDFNAEGSKDFVRQFYPQRDKEGLIFDVRWNRGGFTSQAVLDVLRRERAGVFVNREGAVSPLPGVGERTWGGVQGINDPWQLMDGSNITIPKDSLASLDGRWVIENEGVAPDIPVEPPPDEAVTGKDLELEVAVRTALERLKQAPPQTPEAPAPLPAYPAAGEVSGAHFGGKSHQ